ncbi:MAG: hypothetical protein AAFY25_07750 [Pseudomonadota bacterium]
MRSLIPALLLTLATPALAEMDFVTDPALCGLVRMDRAERGMTFTGQTFFEIEYHCELADPFPPVGVQDYTHMSLGYCEAPGEVFPTLFVLRSFASEPGVLYVYEPENSEGTAFFNCGP